MLILCSLLDCKTSLTLFRLLKKLFSSRPQKFTPPLAPFPPCQQIKRFKSKFFSIVEIKVINSRLIYIKLMNVKRVSLIIEALLASGEALTSDVKVETINEIMFFFSFDSGYCGGFEEKKCINEKVLSEKSRWI